jgi:hypothetical protein
MNTIDRKPLKAAFSPALSRCIICGKSVDKPLAKGAPKS